MAIINYPTEHERISSLFTGMKTRHDADVLLPGGSVLTNYLNEHSINLATDATDVAAADTAHTEFLIKEKLSEKLREKRDNLFDPHFKHHRDMVQFLKKLKRGKVHELGDWGVIVDGDDRIVYPTGITAKIISIKDFIAKHNTFPAGTSPLQPYLNEHPDIDLVQAVTDVDDAKTAHDDFEQAAKDSEEQRELRDLKMIDPIDHLLGIGQYLMGLYSSSPRRLGDWTFTVDDTTRKEVLRKYELPEGAEKIIRDGVQGSAAENSGSTELLIYPGKTTDTSPLTVPAGKKFIIARGMGTIVAKNPSLETKAEITLTVNVY